MSYIDAIIYGVIQGIAEFLPISSSGHLALLPIVRGIEDPGVAFDLAMHVGTALAVIVYFNRSVFRLIMESFGLIGLVKNERYQDFSFSLNFIVATSVTVIFAFACKGFAESWGRSSTLIAFNLFFFGIIMFIADRSIVKNNLKGKKLFFSSLIGLFQAFAIFPGVSRSGATLSIARFLKISREEAAGFSFLLSLPIIIGGFLLRLPELLDNGTIYLGPVIVGMLSAFLIGILTIHLFIKTISKMGLTIFAAYRVVLAGVIIYYLGFNL
jgi:undecaprenyl-diphosphatase